MPDKTKAAGQGGNGLLALGAVALIGGGIYLATRKAGAGTAKKAGDPVAATLTFDHVGPGGFYDIGFGIGLKDSATIAAFFAENVSIANHPIKAKSVFVMTDQPIPAGLEPGEYWAVPFIQNTGGALSPDLAGILKVGPATSNVFKLE